MYNVSVFSAEYVITVSTCGSCLVSILFSEGKLNIATPKETIIPKMKVATKSPNSYFSLSMIATKMNKMIPIIIKTIAILFVLVLPPGLEPGTH